MTSFSTYASAGMIGALGLFACAGDSNDESTAPSGEIEEIEAAPSDSGAPGEARRGAAEREASPEIDEETFDAFATDNRDFAFALLDQLRDEEGDESNVFASPHSISIALAMTYAGAEADTREEMAEVLRFQLEDGDLHPAFNALDRALEGRSEVETEGEGEAFELDIVNQLWGHEDFDVEEDYLDILARHYGAAMKVVDFVENYESIREDINAWVEDQTNGRIEHLLPGGSLSDLTRLVLVNAIYFYGSWAHPFDEEHTAEEAFRRLDGSETDVPLMRETSRFGHYEDDETVAVSLPYTGGDVSLVAFMPADPGEDFRAWEAEFGRADFDAVIGGLDTRETRVFLPKFEDEGSYSLVDAFETMGMIDAFDECAADFRGITGAEPCTPYESVHISDIFHQSNVSIDEEGTEAAAATAVVMDTREAAPPEPAEVRFDRPFSYAIYDHPTDTVLFLGRMVDPS